MITIYRTAPTASGSKVKWHSIPDCDAPALRGKTMVAHEVQYRDYYKNTCVFCDITKRA